MLVGVHAHAAFKRHQTGVERYARRLLETMLRLDAARAHQWKLYTPQPPADTNDSLLVSCAQTVRWPLPVGWTQVRLPFTLRRDRPDVFLAPSHAVPPGVATSVAVVHGIEFEIIPNMYSPLHRRYLRWITQRSVARADCVIAASGATKRDLVERYHVDPDRVVVIHHGVDGPPDNGITLPDDTPPFLLTIGRLETKKNIETLISAFEILVARGYPHHLVLLGGDGWGSRQIHQRIAASSARERITVTGFVPEREKWAMLERADVFVFPSHYEGFGFPVLEAQAARTPVVASRISSLPEILGETALLVDPQQPLAFVDAIETILRDSDCQRRLVRAGRENVRQFSWDNTAEATLSLLETLA